MTTGFGGSAPPRCQWFQTWRWVTARYPCRASHRIWPAKSRSLTYSSGYGASAGGAAITWYMRMGTGVCEGFAAVAESPDDTKARTASTAAPEVKRKVVMPGTVGGASNRPATAV